METIAQTLEISAAEVGRKLRNRRCQMNSELRKIKMSLNCSYISYS